MLKFYGVSAGDLEAKTSQNMQITFSCLPAIWHSWHLKVRFFLSIFLHLEHMHWRKNHKNSALVLFCTTYVLYSGEERVMARGRLGGDIYRLLLGPARRYYEQEMEIRDKCQT